MNFHTILHSTQIFWIIWTLERAALSLTFTLWIASSCTPSQMLCVWRAWWAHNAAVTWSHPKKMCTCLLLMMMRCNCLSDAISEFGLPSRLNAWWSCHYAWLCIVDWTLPIQQNELFCDNGHSVCLQYTIKTCTNIPKWQSNFKN